MRPAHLIDRTPTEPRPGGIDTTDHEHHYAFIRRELCACGGWLVSPAHPSDATILAIVTAHNASSRHARWRERRCLCKGDDG